MQIITLTTDLGTKDNYVAQLKAKLYSSCPNALIVDVSHEIDSFNIMQEIYQINGCINDFPDGTIHVLGVDSEPTVNLTEGRVINAPSILKYKNQYFIGADNGSFGLLLNEDEPQGLWRIQDVLSNPKNMKDPTKFMLLPAAIALFNGKDIADFAEEVDIHSYLNSIPYKPRISQNEIVASIIHVDFYGNLIINVRENEFRRFGDTPFEIILNRKNIRKIDRLSGSYGDVGFGEPVAFFNTANYLEIALNKSTIGNRGGATNMLSLNVGDQILIRFTPIGSATSLNEIL